MDIILEFESKLKNIWWEKVYSAREIMKIFWYDKWERFYWAISRAKIELKDETKISKNFFYIVNKETWGRPKEDVLLTLWACYLLLKKCDNRKQNIIILLHHLESILKEQKELKKIDSIKIISLEKIFVIIIVIFLFISWLFYLTTYIHYFNIDSDNKYLYDVNKLNIKEIIKEQIHQEKVFKEYDDKINDYKIAKLKQNEPIMNAIIPNIDSKIADYIKNWWSDIKKIHKDFNNRSDFSKKLLWEELIKAYFEFWNKKMYRESCSLLSPKYCLSSSKSNLKSFSNFWEKTKNWYENIEVKKIISNKDKQIYCISYKYKLKYDTSNNFIMETFHYTTEIKDWYEQISQRFCEQISKWWKKINCPFQINTYYCK